MCIDSKNTESVSAGSVRSETNNTNMDTTDSDTLKLHQISGGSVVLHAPVFSSNEENLYVIWTNKVRCFNVTTGELLRDFDGVPEDTVFIGIKIHDKNLVACSELGKLVVWKQKSGVIVSDIDVCEKNTKVKAFDIMTINDEAMVIIHYKRNGRAGLELRLLSTGKLYQALYDPVKIRSPTIKISVGSADQQYFCFIQDYQLKMLQFTNDGRYRFEKVGNEDFIDYTVIACHPTEQLVACGDRIGKIVIVRNMFDRSRLVKQYYHWHDSQVNTLCWSTLGRNFYSGGDQCVLVKWTLDQPNVREFYPRMPGALQHISTTVHSDNFAVSTSDNGIYMFKSNRLIGQIQNFTWISEDGTELNKFPAGMKIDPRNTSLVLNGRAGHLQFYSPHTKSLLFNIDITQQNNLSRESDKIIYNTRITNVAMNINWMATSESWDDKEHMPELRLKFWAFDEQNQRYTLNTNVEFAHEGLITALEFSSLYNVDNLLCATAGKDNYIKLWSLEDSESIYRKGKVWMCIKKLTYKNLPIGSVSFSQDGSLLAAGAGSCLCIWGTDDKFQLKCALTAPSALDGSTNKLLTILSTEKPGKNKSSKVDTQKANEKRKKILEQMKSLLLKRDTSIMQSAVRPEKSRFVPQKAQGTRILPRNLSAKEKQVVCRRILGLNELNVSQKVNLCARLGVACRLGADEDLRRELVTRNKGVDIKRQLTNMSRDRKYEFRRRYSNIMRRKSSSRVSLGKLLNFSGDFSGVQKSLVLENGNSPSKNSFLHLNGHATTNGDKPNEVEDPVAEKSTTNAPVKDLAQINRVLFAHGALCHLVIVCTENRLLIWNLLNLRLQTAVKLSVKDITIDSFTNAVGAFTIHNELYVFMPDTPIPLYHRRNLPNIEGAAWIPRRQPRSQSINVDWQATSQLYFISDKQELLCLMDKNDFETVAPSKFFGDAAQPLPKTPFAAMIAKQISSDKEKTKTHTWTKVGTREKEAVKEIMSLSNHAMPAVNRLCRDFLKSLLIVESKDDNKSVSKELDLQKLDKAPPTLTNESDDDDMDGNAVRKTKLKQIDVALASATTNGAESDYFKIEKSLKSLVSEKVSFDF